MDSQSVTGSFWGAHAARVLVSAARRNELFLSASHFVARSIFCESDQKVCEARTASPTRGTRALPRKSAI
jgi:hypothetical protein